MYEVEVKIRAAHDPVRERLSAIGAEPLGRVRQRDTYYDHPDPDRDFVETDEALRLRRESGVEDDGGAGDPAAPTQPTTLTYKGPRVDAVAKTREEVETGVADADAADALLRSVGFEPAAVVEKERERFVSDGYTVALDRVEGLGEFVEVEAEAEAGEVGALRDGAVELCRRLGLDPDAAVPTTYLGLLLGDD